MGKRCAVEGCDTSARARGWCGKHYQRWQIHGSPDWQPPRAQTIAQRLQDGIKRCSVCGDDKPLGDFYKSGSSPDGVASRCKPCNNAVSSGWKAENPERVRVRQRDRAKINERNRLRRTTPEGRRVTLDRRLRQDHGITLVEYEELVAAQSGLCAICGLPPSGETHADERLHLDHDHATGRIRGLLCRYCNTGLGLLDDDLARLAAAARYLDAVKQAAP